MTTAQVYIQSVLPHLTTLQVSLNIIIMLVSILFIFNLLIIIATVTTLQTKNINLTCTCSLSGINFNWDAPFSDCPAIDYSIQASNCGSCPTTTNYTNVTCTGKSIDGRICEFSVQSAICRTEGPNFTMVPGAHYVYNQE